MSTTNNRRSLFSGDNIGKYQIEDIIHKGAFRTIYKAHDPFLDRDVAIKVSTFPDEQESEENSQQLRNSFFLETRAIGKLQHPNIVSVYDAGVGDRQTYIVMEYINAKSLTSILKNNEKLSVEKVIDIIFKCCKALEYAHAKNVIHRDIKPGNILLADSGDVKIVDFGVAKIRDNIDTMSTGIYGSPSYMAPEQVEEHSVRPSTDLYALGAVFYELLTGKRLFQADNVHTLLYKILNEPPNSLHDERVEHASKLQPILDQVLAKDPENRYPSASDFAKALQSIDQELRYEERRIEKKVNTNKVSSLRFFHEFTEQQLYDFSNTATWLKISEGETIVSAGEIDQMFYVIIDGNAVVFKENKPVKTLIEGDCFGELGILRHEQRVTSIMASTEMMLMKLSTSELDKMPSELQAPFYKAVAHSIVKRLSDNDIAADKAA